MFSYPEVAYNTRSAEEIVPYLNELFAPMSVLDVGCGIGTWLSVFSKFSNVQFFYGVDGTYTDLSRLLIDESQFKAIDLERPFELHQKFDLVLCLEVAEHLSPGSADDFISSLVKHGDVIVFSAAIPNQGGDRHVNEQWPEYWQQKFMKHGFHAYDILRQKFWTNNEVEWWYRQNMILYIREHVKTAVVERSSDCLLSFIHPLLFRNKINELHEAQYALKNLQENPGIMTSVKNVGKALKRRLST